MGRMARVEQVKLFLEKRMLSLILDLHVLFRTPFAKPNTRPCPFPFLHARDNTFSREELK
jgi:hypothetical protein